MEIELLRRLAAIDATTLNVHGVNLAQDLVGERLRTLGFTVVRHSADPRFGDFLVAERAGRDPRFITLVTHVDTVLPNYRTFTVDPSAGRAFGSGVIDNKGGVTVGLIALKNFIEAQPRSGFGLRFVCSPNEEMGSIGFTARLRELGRSTAFAFGLEPALDDGSIIHQRRGNRWYDVEITGRAAHAGRSYGHHANAAHDAAEKIVRLAALTDYRRHVSVSVGALSGGQDKHNIVCGEARFKLDVRFPTFPVRDRLHRRIERILDRAYEVSVDRKYRTRTSFEIVDDCPPFSLTARSKRLARVYAAMVAGEEGVKITSRAAGGAGDVNYLSTEDNLVLDGFGPVGGEMHTTEEFLRLDTLASRARALAKFLAHVQTLV